jgi:hypothetical protein
VENQKPKSVKTVGLLITIFSFFIIFSNFSGMLAGQMFVEMTYSDDFNAIDFILKLYKDVRAYDYCRIIFYGWRNLSW